MRKKHRLVQYLYHTPLVYLYILFLFLISKSFLAISANFIFYHTSIGRTLAM